MVVDQVDGREVSVPVILDLFDDHFQHLREEVIGSRVDAAIAAGGW